MAPQKDILKVVSSTWMLLSKRFRRMGRRQRPQAEQSPPRGRVTLPVQDLPFEILTMIIIHLLQPTFSLYRAIQVIINLRSSPATRSLTSNRDVLNACMVNQSWYLAGKHVLYFRVVLHDLPQMKNFDELLRQKPALCAHVHELVFLDDLASFPDSASEPFRLAIISACPQLQDISFHITSAFAPEPNASERLIPISPSVDSVLVTGLRRYPTVLFFANPNNLRVLTLYEVSLDVSTISVLPNELHHLYSLSIIGSRLTTPSYQNVCESLQNIHSLRVLQLVDFYIRLLTPEEGLDPASITFACPENIERFSFINNTVTQPLDVPGISIMRARISRYPNTLRELQISVIHISLSIELPPMLACLVLFFDWTPFPYTPDINAIRMYLEQNLTTVARPAFKAVTMVLDPNERWQKPQEEDTQELQLLLSLCERCSLSLTVVPLKGTCL